MKKQRWFLLLAALFTALLLCGCDEYDDRYEDEEFLTQWADQYAVFLWQSNIHDDGSCSLKAGSFTGVRTLGAFTVEEDQTLCEVTSTLTGTGGEAKLLLVNTGDKTLAAQWPLDSQEPLTATLPAGEYDLRIAGKSAGFEGEVSMTLNGQPVAWNSLLDEFQDAVEEVVTGELQGTWQEMGDTAENALAALRDAA